MIITDITLKIRALLKDFAKTERQTFEYTTSNVFFLDESRVNSISAVYVNGVATTSYTYSSVTNAVTVSAALTAGDIVLVVYNYYQRHTDTEIAEYIRAALVYVSICKLGDYELETDEIQPDPYNDVADLIARVAAVVAEPIYVSVAFPNMKITYPHKKSKDELIVTLIEDFVSREFHGYSTTMDTTPDSIDGE